MGHCARRPSRRWPSASTSRTRCATRWSARSRRRSDPRSRRAAARRTPSTTSSSGPRRARSRVRRSVRAAIDERLPATHDEMRALRPSCARSRPPARRHRGAPAGGAGRRSPEGRRGKARRRSRRRGRHAASRKPVQRSRMPGAGASSSPESRATSARSSPAASRPTRTSSTWPGSTPASRARRSRSVDFIEADIRNPVIATLIPQRRGRHDGAQPDRPPARARECRAATMHDMNVIGSLQLLAACEKADTVARS